MFYRRGLKDVLLYLKGTLTLLQYVLKMSKRCLIGDDLQMSYQKMPYRCLTGDISDISFRCFIDVLSIFYLIYLK